MKPIGTTMIEDLCKICGKDVDRHRDLESDGIINHKFSRDGALETLERAGKKTDRRQEVMVVPGADLTLRKLLIEKGILSEQDFIDAGALGSGPRRDNQDRPAEGSH